MHILLIEDENQFRYRLKKNLEAECYAVDAAANGTAGLALAQSHDYDLVICDNVLPDKNGHQICSELRAEGRQFPIMIMSVVADVDVKIDLLNAGADDYLAKPFPLPELLARLRALLRRPPNWSNENCCVGDLQLDLRRHFVSRNGADIDLTKKEFQLLSYLVQNQGQVLSRGLIMEKVWGADVDPFSNTIEAHINSLRRKIHLPGCKKLIRTVNGRGYKIVNPA